MPTFDELPFNTRPDMSPYLVHLTKNTKPNDEYSAYDNLVNILMTGEIWGSGRRGMVKGTGTASCFMDVPFASFKYVLTPDNTDLQTPRYEPYGIAVRKKEAYEGGCRPVLYLSNDELEQLCIPKTELWRVVRFEVNEGEWISWLHEREWRCKGSFTLPSRIHAAFVRDTAHAKRLMKELILNPTEFKCIPRSVIPFTIMCQGLLK